MLVPEVVLVIGVLVVMGMVLEQNTVDMVLKCVGSGDICSW